MVSEFSWWGQEGPVVQEVAKSETELDAPWMVIVMNDPVNLMDYVVLVFERVFGYDREKATQLMLEVHQLGLSVVWTGTFEKAEAYVYTLQTWQLTAKLEKEQS